MKKKRGFELKLPTDHAAIYHDLLRMNHGISHGSIICRTELLRGQDGYWDVHGFHDDLDMILRMSEEGELANLPQALYLYRMREESHVGQHLAEVRNYYHYAIDCAVRRKDGLEKRSPEVFFAERQQRPWYQKAREAMDLYALHEYRLACIAICARRPVRGYLRLAWAALCSPRRTLDRLSRIFTRSVRNDILTTPTTDEKHVPAVDSHPR